MGEEIKPFVIKKTQDSLGKFLKRPPLTEKLLKKPPFRFLHDIITAVIRQYGLMEGLFTAEEMVSDNVKDKDSKIAFLQKVIDTMKLVTGGALSVRPSKVVAGQEPAKTNELLQAIARALDKKLSSKKAVEQVLAKSRSEDPPVSESKSKKVSTRKKSESKETPARKSKRADSQQPGASQRAATQEQTPPEQAALPQELVAPEEQARPPPELLATEEQTGPPPELLTNEEQAGLPPPVERESAPEPAQAVTFEPSAPQLTPEPAAHLESSPLAAQDEAVLLGSEQPGPHSPPSSTEASRAPTAVAAAAPRPASVRPGSAKPRPLTARPAAPRLKERVVRPAEEPIPQAAVTPAQLILDSGKLEEDDSTFLVEEEQPQEAPEPTVSLLDTAEPAGHLVTQILGTQRQLEDSPPAESQQSWGGVEAARREVARLREAVQGLVRAATPLARLLDFLQEDVESMQLELEQWRAESSALAADIAREARNTEESLQPLRRELAELTAQAEQQRQANAALKTAVILNDGRLLDNLLRRA